MFQQESPAVADKLHDAKACQNCSNSTCLQHCCWQDWSLFICL